MLDTAPLAAYLHDRPAAIELISPWIRTREASSSILVYGEVIEYLRGRSNFAHRKDQLRTLLRTVPSYFLTYAIVDRYAELRSQLRPLRGPGLIGDVDALIAANALKRNQTVVTTDSDFDRIPNLELLFLPRRSI